MIRLAPLALVSVALLGFAPGQGAVDPEKLAAVRRLSPEDRARMLKKLEEIKKLPVEERERLKENLKKIKAMAPEEVRRIRDRAQRLSDQEARDYSELAAGFFKWAHRNGYAQGFPRGQFFQWLKHERPGKIEEIRAMEPGVGSQRVDEFVRLYHEFRRVTLLRAEEAVRRRGIALEELQELRDASPRDFWPRWAELMKSAGGRKPVPGPVGPRPADKK